MTGLIDRHNPNSYDILNKFTIYIVHIRPTSKTIIGRFILWIPVYFSTSLFQESKYHVFGKIFFVYLFQMVFRLICEYQTSLYYFSDRSYERFSIIMILRAYEILSARSGHRRLSRQVFSDIFYRHCSIR